jgi:hypothetical protein
VLFRLGFGCSSMLGCPFVVGEFIVGVARWLAGFSLVFGVSICVG